MKNSIFGLLLGCILLMSGCATPTVPTAMVPEVHQNYHRSGQSLSINVLGGRETSATGTSQIANDDFHRAVAHAVDNSAIFASVGNYGSTDLHLETFIGMLQQPLMGFNLTVTLEVYYALTESATGNTLWRDTIQSTYTATTGEAFAGITRLRLATEGAARENIRQLLKALSDLQLD